MNGLWNGLGIAVMIFAAFGAVQIGIGICAYLAGKGAYWAARAEKERADG